MAQVNDVAVQKIWDKKGAFLMSNTPIIFKHSEFGSIRGIEIHGKAWLVGKDVAVALGYSDAFGALKKHVDEEDKLVCPIDSAGQKRATTVINESGLYSLIFSSKLPNAKKIKSWIDHDVLPVLRKHDNSVKNDDITSETPVNTSNTNEKCAIQIFENPEFGQVRMIEEDGKMLFCGKDVARALGYVDPVNALKQHCRGVVKRHLIDSVGRKQETNFISEGDVYRLIMYSKLPTAVKFENWVFEEVLPGIRKTGMYISSPQYDISALSPELQIFKQIFDGMVQTQLEQKRQAEEQKRIIQEQEQQAQALKTVDQKIDDIREIVVIHPDNWREQCRRLTAAIAQKRGGSSEAYRNTNAEIFELVDKRGKVSLQTRLTNRRNRMADAGIGKCKQNKLNKVDVIADDNKLIEIYIAIVKEMCIQYSVSIRSVLCEEFIKILL